MHEGIPDPLQEIVDDSEDRIPDLAQEIVEDVAHDHAREIIDDNVLIQEIIGRMVVQWINAK